MQIILGNIYYLFKLDINVILLRILKEKKYVFCTINSLLQIKN